LRGFVAVGAAGFETVGAVALGVAEVDVGATGDVASGRCAGSGVAGPMGSGVLVEASPRTAGLGLGWALLAIPTPMPIAPIAPTTAVLAVRTVTRVSRASRWCEVHGRGFTSTPGGGRSGFEAAFRPQVHDPPDRATGRFFEATTWGVAAAILGVDKGAGDEVARDAVAGSGDELIGSALIVAALASPKDSPPTPTMAASPETMVIRVTRVRSSSRRRAVHGSFISPPQCGVRPERPYADDSGRLRCPTRVLNLYGG